MTYAEAWAAAFLLTEVVEVPIYLAAFKASGKAPPWMRAGIAAFGASLLTHPIVWFIIPRFWAAGSYGSMVLFAESFAVVAEALYLWRFGIKRPLAWSLLGNGASFGLGWLSSALAAADR